MKTQKCVVKEITKKPLTHPFDELFIDFEVLLCESALCQRDFKKDKN